MQVEGSTSRTLDESLFGKQGEDFKRGSLDNLEEERQFRGEDTSTPTLTAAVPNSKSPKILYNFTTNWKTMELYLGLRFFFLSYLRHEPINWSSRRCSHDTF